MPLKDIWQLVVCSVAQKFNKPRPTGEIASVVLRCPPSCRFWWSCSLVAASNVAVGVLCVARGPAATYEASVGHPWALSPRTWPVPPSRPLDPFRGRNPGRGGGCRSQIAEPGATHHHIRGSLRDINREPKQTANRHMIKYILLIILVVILIKCNL